MYIRKIRIRNYKSISFLEFEPAKINIIVGRNSTGKSTILEAISLGASSPIYRDCLNHDILKNVIERSESSLIKFGNDSAEIELEISNKDDNITRRCVRILEVSKFMREYYNIYEKVSKHFKDILYSEPKLEIFLKVLKRLLHKYTSSEYSLFSEDLELCGEDVSKGVLNMFRIVLLSFVNEECINAILIRTVGFDKVCYYTINLGEFNSTDLLKVCRGPSDLGNAIIRLDLESPEVIDKVLENVRNYFSELVNIRVRGLRTRRPYATLRCRDKLHVVPVDSLGGGVKMVIELELLAEACREGILLLEEPEIKLHPAYIQVITKRLVNLVQKNKISQLYITTHSIELIRGIVENLEESEKLQDVELVRTYNMDGEIDYEILDGSDVLRELKDLEADIRGI